jgi:hypothetical protein
MDPASLGIAAAALVASGAAGQFATQLGDSAWASVQKLVDLTRRTFAGVPACPAVERLSTADGTDEDRQVVEAAIAARAREDGAFFDEIRDLVAAAGSTVTITAQANDNARQMNAGTVFGDVNLG